MRFLQRLAFGLATAVALVSQAQADVVIDQLGAPFSLHTPPSAGGFGAAYSQWDTDPTLDTAGGQIRNFATAFDNFSFNFAGNITELAWAGAYEDPADRTDLTSTIGTPANPTFRVSIWSDAAGEPGALAQVFTGVSAVETATPVADYFQYTTTGVNFNFTANTQYWVSIAAELNYDQEQGWLLAFSNMGDGQSVQEFGDTLPGTTRFYDDFDYAVRITAVPEPSGIAVLALVGATLGFRRFRRN